MRIDRYETCLSAAFQRCARRRWSILWTALVVLLISTGSAVAWIQLPEQDSGFRDDRDGVHVVDGSYVMNVGELQVNITNHGLIGSQYSVLSMMSDAPSGQWPAGTGDEYLWSAGLWIGAVAGGQHLVSTGQYERELRPLADWKDTIYEARGGYIVRPPDETGLRGRRAPDPGYDDDGDGRMDEETLNGYDDDGDGLIDEDFGQVGDQMMVCTMYDNTPLSREVYPDHVPMNLKVVQKAYAWQNDDIDDFVGLEFRITNIGAMVLHDVYLGIFADCDIGPRRLERTSLDDLAGSYEGFVRASDGSYACVSVGYMYDGASRDRLPGYFGVAMIDYTRDINEIRAPRLKRMRSFQIFTGEATYEQGGDPSNDGERYNLMSRLQRDPDVTPGRENDYRFLITVGPFPILEPDSTLVLQTALVVGNGLEGMLHNCAEASSVVHGMSFDHDGEYWTGSGGMETKVCKDEYWLPDGSNLLLQRSPIYFDTACLPDSNLGLSVPYITDDLFFRDEDGRKCVYVDTDKCWECERQFGRECTKENRLVLASNCSNPAVCTGVRGGEQQVNWLFLGSLPPPPPDMRLWEADGKVHVYWDDLSEISPDPQTGYLDFESYRVYRADNWERPLGSSLENGPESSLWRLIAEYDLVSQYVRERHVSPSLTVLDTLPLGHNTGFDAVRYRPVCLDDPRFAGLGAAMQAVVDQDSLGRWRERPQVRMPGGEPVPGLEGLLPWEGYPAVLDTFYAVTERAAAPENGVVGKRAVGYYEYVDHNVHNGFLYFYAVVASDHLIEQPLGEAPRIVGHGLIGDPATNFLYGIPSPRAQTAKQRQVHGANIYVYPDPVTNKSLAEFQRLNPSSEDPTGYRIMFVNLPRAHNHIQIFTLDGDLVAEIDHDGMDGYGQASWNLVSRNGQQAASGIYLYVVQSDDDRFDDFIGKFVVIR